jgi:hypothetical protein
MSSESVYQVACTWVEVGSFHTRLFGVVYFAIASVREFLDHPRMKQRCGWHHTPSTHKCVVHPVT